MDPLTVFSVACNVLQVAQYGANILTRAYAYRKAADGQLDEIRDLRASLDSLKRNNGNIGQILSPKPQGTGIVPAETALKDANDRCLRVLTSFATLLDDLEIKDHRTILNALHKAVKSVRRQGSETHNNAEAKLCDSLRQATNASQEKLLMSQSRLEKNTIDQLTSSSNEIRSDLTALKDQLQSLDMGQALKTFDDFSASHKGFLQQLSVKLESMPDIQTSDERFQNEQTRRCQDRVLSSLNFPQMNGRKDQISSTFEDTCEWILDSSAYDSQQWSDFQEWIKAPELAQKSLYWIKGKPGSGKSTMMKFLVQRLDKEQHMMPWVESSHTLLQVHYFFWSSGHTLQKSLIGMIRSLLYQVFWERRDLIEKCVSQNRWESASSEESIYIDWSHTELHKTIQNCLLRVSETTNVLILLDGLDNVDDKTEEQGLCIALLQDLLQYPKIKLCVSSRPLNIYKDAFGEFPSLPLEQFNTKDFEIYVNGRLNSQKRFQMLRKRDAKASNDLIKAIVNKAKGVFLWICLAVNELTRHVCNGVNIKKLKQLLEEVPADLDQYFWEIWNSIALRDRGEASKLLQIVLLNQRPELLETRQSLPIRLIDLFFLDDAEEFVEMFTDLRRSSGMGSRPYQDVHFVLDSIIRLLNSRCKGLLECTYYDSGFRDLKHLHTKVASDLKTLSQKILHGDNEGNERPDPAILEGVAITKNGASEDSKVAGLHEWEDITMVLGDFVFDFHVEFLHESLKDFLVLDQTRKLLNEHYYGLDEMPHFLFKSRAAQIHALYRAGLGTTIREDLCRYVMRECASKDAGKTFLPAEILEEITLRVDSMFPGFYESGRARKDEDPCAVFTTPPVDLSKSRINTLFTVALLAGFSKYSENHLTIATIQEKQGRPVLDLILRPEPPRVVNLKLLTLALENGADPNQLCYIKKPVLMSSLWAVFLSFIKDSINRENLWKRAKAPTERRHVHIRENAELYIQALLMLVKSGAKVFLPHQFLLAYPIHAENTFRGNHELVMEAATRWMTESERIECLEEGGAITWPQSRKSMYKPYPGVPFLPYAQSPNGEVLYRVTDVIEHFREALGDGIDEIQAYVDLLWVQDARRSDHRRVSIDGTTEIQARIDWQIQNARRPKHRRNTIDHINQINLYDC